MHCNTSIPLGFKQEIDPLNVFLPTPSNTADTPLLFVIFITSLEKSSFV